MNQAKEKENQSPEQNQNLAEPGPGLPEVMEQESPRKCKICGGPNHHGCGCEARAAKAAGIVSNEHIKKEPPEPKQRPAETYAETTANQRPSDAERGEILIGHIEAMSDNLSDAVGVMQQCRDLLQAINDNILAQKIVEVKDVNKRQN